MPVDNIYRLVHLEDDLDPFWVYTVDTPDPHNLSKVRGVLFEGINAEPPRKFSSRHAGNTPAIFRDGEHSMPFNISSSEEDVSEESDTITPKKRKRKRHQVHNIQQTRTPTQRRSAGEPDTRKRPGNRSRRDKSKSTRMRNRKQRDKTDTTMARKEAKQAPSREDSRN